jgi:protein TonB
MPTPRLPPLPSTRPKPGPSSAVAVKDKPATGTPNHYENVSSVTYLRRSRAVYPAQAIRKNQTGTVTLTLYINELGSVDTVEVSQSSGSAQLDAAAVAAERKSKFRPLVRNGRPIKTKARVPYTFELR